MLRQEIEDGRGGMVGVFMVNGLVHEYTLVDFPPLVKRNPLQILERSGCATTFSPSQNGFGGIALAAFKIFLGVGGAPVIYNVPVIEMGNHKSVCEYNSRCLRQEVVSPCNVSYCVGSA